MATVANEILEAALEYADRGWRIVPVDRETKHPPLKAWQKKATTDAGKIERWWLRWPDANVGIQFGPTSGIVDFETDSDQGEKDLRKVFGGEVPYTCAFRSGSGRGVHRIFKFRDDLPPKANRNWSGIDFKLGVDDKGSQSLFPPSIHSSGGRYQWLEGLSLNECDILDLPDIAVAFLWNLCEGDDDLKPSQRSVEHWEGVFAGVPEGSRRTNFLSVVGKLLHEWGDLSSSASVQVAFQLASSVNDRNNPPLDEKELKEAFLDLLKKERRKRARSDFEETSSPTPEQAIEGQRAANDFRLTIVESEPPIYELYSDRFAEAENGCIVCTAEQLISGRGVRLQSLKQANCALPGTFTRAWERKGGLYEQVVSVAERRPASADQKRTSVVALRIYEQIEKAKTAGDLNEPDFRGRPTKMSDGSIVFGFNCVWDELRFSADGVTRLEIARVLEKVGVAEYRPRQSGSRKRFRVASAKAIESLLDLGTAGTAPR